MKLLIYMLLLLSLSAVAEKRPQVLIIGDVNYNSLSREVASVLKDRADVQFTKYGSYHSGKALEEFDKLLEGKKWDLIHFNYGLYDVMYRDPKSKETRALHKDVGGVRVSSPEQYEKNLRELVKRFRATGAKLVWASTTPIIGSDGILQAGDEVLYNEIAAKVMNELKVPITDMYKRGKESHAAMNERYTKTFSYKGGLSLSPPIVGSLMKELNLKKKIKGPVKVFLMIGDKTLTGQGLISDARKPRAGRAGTLDDLVLNAKTAGEFEHLISDKKTWLDKDDVWVRTSSTSFGNLRIGFGERQNRFGPELGFGHYIGSKLDPQVLIIKAAGIGKLSDNKFFADKNGDYSEIIGQVDDTVKRLDETFPDYSESVGCQYAGAVIGFNQGEANIKKYTENLTRLIKQLRADLKSPDLPVVLLGPGDFEKDKKLYMNILKAQQTIASQLSKVNFLDVKPFWPDKAKSPEKSEFDWYGNAASFYKMGVAAAEELQKLK